MYNSEKKMDNKGEVSMNKEKLGRVIRGDKNIAGTCLSLKYWELRIFCYIKN